MENQENKVYTAEETMQDAIYELSQQLSDTGQRMLQESNILDYLKECCNKQSKIVNQLKKRVSVMRDELIRLSKEAEIEGIEID